MTMARDKQAFAANKERVLRYTWEAVGMLRCAAKQEEVKGQVDDLADIVHEVSEARWDEDGWASEHALLIKDLSHYVQRQPSGKPTRNAVVKYMAIANRYQDDARQRENVRKPLRIDYADRVLQQCVLIRETAEHASPAELPVFEQVLGKIQETLRHVRKC